MATGFPVKANYATGDILTATNLNDLAGTLNSVTSTTLSSQAGKNPVINGGMDIWQRGTSFTYSPSNTTTYTADRWQTYSNTVATSITRQASALTGFRYCARVQRPNANTATSSINWSQSIETNDSVRFAGQSVTFSFYARAGANYSANSNALVVQLLQGTGTDENALIAGFTGQTNIVASTSAILTTSWQRFTYTGTVASTTTEIASYYSFTPTGTAGAADYFEITGVQLELGSAATTFSRSGGTIQGELAACQRYYYRQTGDNLYANFGIGTCNATTTALVNVMPPVTMRVKPSAVDFSTLRIYDGSVGQSVTALALNTDSSGATMPQVTATIGSAGFTLARNAFLQGNNSASAYIGFNAEL